MNMTRLIAASSALVLVGLMALIVATLWAQGKSVERTNCYRHATAATDCSAPSKAEALVRRIVS